MAEVFRYTHRVSYSECTVGNHVYYARYPDIVEKARGEFLRSIGQTFFELQAQDTIFPVVEVHLRYKAPARYDDTLEIQVWLTELGKLRLNFGYRILNKSGALISEGETWHVCTSMNERPKRLPEALAANLHRFLVTATPPEQR